MPNKLRCPVSGQTIVEEIANSITHGLGLLLSVAGLVVLIVFAWLVGKDWALFSSLFYGFSLIILYAASTIYHIVIPKRAKTILQIFDHASIYILIAGTYTPVALITFGGTWGWTLFGLEWGLAVIGIILKVFLTGRYEGISIIVYLVMGWFILVDITTLYQTVPGPGFILLVTGGITYSLGVIFYIWEKLPFSHSIWHIFVLGGSILHFFFVLLYIIM